MRRAATLLLAIGFLTILVTVTTMVVFEGSEHEHAVELTAHADTHLAPVYEAIGAAEHEEDGDFFPMTLHKLGGLTIILAGLVHIFFNYKILLRNAGLRR